MITYVRSRGREQDHGYRWHELVDGAANATPLAPPVYRQMGLAALAGAPGVVLGRFHGYVVLLVSGLASHTKVDFYPRRIANSVLWAGEPHDEETLREACLNAVRRPEEFCKTLDRAIVLDAANGFRVEPAVLNALLHGQAAGSAPAPSRRVIRAFSVEAVAAELAFLENTALPEYDGPHVVFNPAITINTMVEAGVWHGVAGHFETDTAGVWEGLGAKYWAVFIRRLLTKVVRRTNVHECK